MFKHKKINESLWMFSNDCGINVWDVERQENVVSEIVSTEVQFGAMESLRCRVKGEKCKVCILCIPLSPYLRYEWRRVNLTQWLKRHVKKRLLNRQVKQGRKTLFKTIAVGERDGTQLH